MIWQIGDSLPFDFAYLASKLGKTGIAVTIKAAYKNGVAIPALAGVAIPEIGNGLFRYLLDSANVDMAGDYVIIATTADTTVDQRDLYAVNVVTAWVADVDVAISSRGTADPGDAMALTAGERTTVAGVFLTQLLEGAHTVGDGLRIMLAALAGKSTGGGTFTNRFRDVADSKNRVVATVDSDGNRTAITTLDGT